MDPREIQQLEQQCIQAHAPACTSSCPMHVDVRALIGAVAKGDFDKALKIFSHTIPFPGIIGRICDHPCQKQCKRKEVGDALSISALERACLEYGSISEESGKPIREKTQRIAVIGGGLSGLTVALELRKKGYRITLYEAADALGGQLRTLSPDILPSSILLRETDKIVKAGISVQLNTTVTVQDLYRDFDAVYYGPGHTKVIDPLLRRNATGSFHIDHVSYHTEIEGVFAGGSLRLSPGCISPISSVADGYRTATSIDRYVKKVSLTASRDHEAPYATELYTNIEGIEPLPAVPMRIFKDRYSRDEAIGEAGRCLQCECMECVKHCGYLAYFDQYPGKCLRSISKNLILHRGFGMRLATKFINACRLCGLCREVCPTDLDLGFVNREARRIMVDSGNMPEAFHYFPIRDMLFSNSEKCTLTRHAPNMESSRFLFFPGCQLTASRPDYVEKTYDYLRSKLHEEVGLMLRCCGVPAEWAGRQECFLEEIHKFSMLWKNMGCPTVVTACPTCHHVLKENLSDIPIESLWEIFERTGLPPDAQRGGGHVLAIHDSCSARYETSIQDSVRRLITQLGYVIEELPLNRTKTECCGYGGLLYHINREVTQRVITDRISLSSADYVSYCSNCRDFFARYGKPSLHLFDLIFGKNMRDEAFHRGPGYSVRNDNRIRLKASLLKRLWGATETMREEFETTAVLISPQMEKKMEDQCILVEDVQRVIHHAERTGNKVFNPDNGHFMAHLRPEIITYWVEYTSEPEGYRIHNAYSHRLQIIEDEIPS